MADVLKRVISEEGIVLEKIYKPARAEIKFKNGDVIKADGEHYYLKCVSGEEFDSEGFGFKNANVDKYEVDSTLFDCASYGNSVLVKFEMGTNGVNTPIGVKLL